VAGTAVNTGSKRIENEGVSGIAGEVHKVVLRLEREGANEGEPQGFDTGTEFRCFVAVKLDGLEEAGFRDGADLIHGGIHKKSYARRETGSGE
jgi:hypothetical protein